MSSPQYDRLDIGSQEFRQFLRFMAASSSTSYVALVARVRSLAFIPLAAGLRVRFTNRDDSKIVNKLTVFTTADTPDFISWERMDGLRAHKLVEATQRALQVVPYGEGRSGWHGHIMRVVKVGAIPYGVVVHDGGTRVGHSNVATEIRSDLAVLMPMIDDRTTIVLLNAAHPEVEQVWKRMVRVDGWSCVLLGIARNMAVLQRLPMPVATAPVPEE